MSKKPTVLVIMDGFGCDDPSDNNAVYLADTKNLDKLVATYPTTKIIPYGIDVGLPVGQMGNSEVGHLNLGAGRIIYQPLTRISKEIDDGLFFENPAFAHATDNAIKHDSAVHLMGLVSDGGVHSHNDHLLALVKLCRDKGIEKIYVHCYMDGRDVPPSSGKAFIEELENNLKDIGAGEIATISGRFYAMDRDNIWDRIELSYDSLVSGRGVEADSAVEAMQNSYDKGDTDEFIKPSVIMKKGEPTGKISPNDSVIFYNFRPDRARQLTRVFIDQAFDGFKRDYFPVCFVTMTVYDATFENVEVAYFAPSYENTLGQYLASQNKTQLRIAETQKYAHVTYFFNGGIEVPNPLEDRVLIDSPKIPTFDLKPEMSAFEVTDKVVEIIAQQKYDAIMINFANCDMVGHTGIIPAAVKAVETVDACVQRVVDATLAIGGNLIITADHGNAEKMWDETVDAPYTAHTSDTPVPVIIVDEDMKGKPIRDGGRLADVAPTMLTLMGLKIPDEMTGESLI